MTGRLIDDDARARAILARDGPLAVEAGAGTGKTSLLVARIVEGILAGQLTIDRLAAITFTRSAAAELRSKLRAQIAQRIGSADGEQLERLLAARRGLPLARLTTVHAFCAHFLREHALAAGLDPDFGTRDEDDDEGLFDQLWEEWLAGILEDDTRGAPLRELAAWGGRLDRLTEAARLLFENPDCGAPEPTAGVDPEAIWNEYTATLQGARDELRGAIKPGVEDLFFEALQKWCDECERLARLPLDARLRSLAGRVSNGELRLTGVNRKAGRKTSYDDPAAFCAVRERLAAWRESGFVSRLIAHFAPRAEAALAALVDFRDWARQARKDRNQLDFVDQLYELSVVLENSAVRRRVQEAVEELLVDEFQDTDPLMARIFDQLCTPSGGPALFVVGDPKQSIYRFRRADITTYLGRVEALARQGRVAPISVNFRTTPVLLERVGQLMKEIFAGRPWPHAQAAWQSLQPSPDARAPQGPVVVLTPVGDRERKLLAEDLAALEADALAQELVRARADGFAWRDMAVLFPRQRRVNLLEGALIRRGVPFRQEKSRRFFLQSEVAELVQTLSAVADPEEPLHVVAALRSRLFGFSDGDLARRHASGRGFALRDAAPAADPAEGQPDIDAALRRIDAWRTLARRLRPPELLEQILADTRFRELLAREPDAARALGNIQRLVERLRTRWDQGGVDLSEVVEWLRRRVADEDVRAAESPAAEEEDRVALLTIHGAKGLEWSLVALFDLRAKLTGMPVAALIDRRDPVQPRVSVRFGSVLQSTGFDEAKQLDDALEEAERARLLYVAATRAKLRLVIPATASDRKAEGTSLLALLEGAPTWRAWAEAAHAGRDVEPGAVVTRRAAAAEEPTGPEAEPPTAAPARASVDAAKAARDEWQVRRRALLASGDRLVVTRPSSLHAAPPESAAERAQAREIGAAVHRALEWLATGVARPEEARAACRRAAEDEGLQDDSAASVVQFVERALSSDLVRRAFAASARSAELPFSWSTKRSDLPAAIGALIEAQLKSAGRVVPPPDGPLTIEGIVDLVFADDGGLVIADYKTDPWSSPEDLDRLAEHYRPQVELYCAALAAILGRSVSETWLLFVGGAETAARLIGR